MSDQLVENIFGEKVLHRVSAIKKPIREMSAEERKLYNSQRQAAHREKKRRELELAEDRKRIEDEERKQFRVEEEVSFAEVPQRWTDAWDTFLNTDTSLDSIATELNRAWIYSHDAETVWSLQKLIFGLKNNFIQTDEESIRVLGASPEAALAEAITSLKTRPHFNRESDEINLNNSPTFAALYRDAVWRAISFFSDERFKPLLDSKLWPLVKQEFAKFEQEEISFAPAGN